MNRENNVRGSEVNKMSLTTTVQELLLEEGATLVGVADLSGIVSDGMNRGVIVAMKVPVHVIAGISDGPTMEYFDAYCEINAKLDEIVTIGAQYLKVMGYRAIAQTTGYVQVDDRHRSKLPHKTVATMAGLGWIGKSALFVTREYGSAIRLSSIITDAPLDCGAPITEGKCGDCMECGKACPGGAISGKLWNNKMDREEFFSASECREAARALSACRIQKEVTLCGKCIEVCPFTRQYIQNYLENRVFEEASCLDEVEASYQVTGKK